MSEKRVNIKKILLSLLWVTIGISTVVLLVAAVRSKDSKRCKGIEINISGANNNFFIDKKDVLAIIDHFSGPAEGKTIQSFNLRQMETSLRKDVWIRNAELFFDNNNILQVTVEEREPVARIFTNGGNTFYIDSSATMLPLSEKFSARVPVFTGFPSEVKVLSVADSSLLFDIRNISMELQADSFLMAMIDQVDITAERNFDMTPKIGDQTIAFGDATDAAVKFKKLKLFYKNIIPHSGWDHYSTIDLQYENQVVAKVKGKEDKAADSLRTLQLMQVMAANAAKASSDSIRSFVQDNDTNNTTDTSMIQQSMQRDEGPVSSISEPNEDPAPTHNALPVMTKPAAVVIPKPISVKPAATKTVLKTPVKKPVIKTTEPKKTDTKKAVQKKVPKAVMKANDY